MTRLEYDWDEALAHLRAADARLAAVIEGAGDVGPIRPDRSLDIYRALLRSIIYQQLSGKAAATILGRLLDLFGGAFPTPAQLLATDADTLRSAGVSRNKAAALHDLARHALDGAMPGMRAARTIDDDELVRRLTAVRGIGPWTVHMLLIFRLGRPDVLPVDDLGVRAGARRTYGLDELPRPAELRAIAEPWRPFRSVGSWYMWRAVELDELPL